MKLCLFPFSFRQTPYCIRYWDVCDWRFRNDVRDAHDLFYRNYLSTVWKYWKNHEKFSRESRHFCKESNLGPTKCEVRLVTIEPRHTSIVIILRVLFIPHIFNIYVGQHFNMIGLYTNLEMKRASMCECTCIYMDIYLHLCVNTYICTYTYMHIHRMSAVSDMDSSVLT